MTMTVADREALLARWVQPSSTTEQAQQDRAWRMVRDAVDGHAIFDGLSTKIYAKGSYPNNTNVRQDSDVDIVVELHECSYYDYASGVTPPSTSPLGKYQGEWTPALWRAEIVTALVKAFGKDSVDTSGQVAINIAAVAGSRPSADVVPSFLYYRYEDANRTERKQGSCVFSTEAERIVNWPDQQLMNGKAKNDATSQRYKKYVRALKRAENVLVDDGVIDELPSYLMECLVFNVPNSTLTSGNSLDYGFQETLRWMYHRLNDGTAKAEWVEPNWCKWLFKGTQKWTPDEAKQLVLKTWNYLGYA